MGSLHKTKSSHGDRAAALIIVLALVVLVTGLVVAYFSRTTAERPAAHSSFNQSKADQLAQSAMDSIIGDIRQEIANGSTNLVAGVTPSATPAYIPKAPAYMVPQRSGNTGGGPNLIRRSVYPDSLSGSPALGSRASALNSAPTNPSNPAQGDVTVARWNRHYLIPRANAGSDGNYTSAPVRPADVPVSRSNAAAP